MEISNPDQLTRDQYASIAEKVSEIEKHAEELYSLLVEELVDISVKTLLEHFIVHRKTDSLPQIFETMLETGKTKEDSLSLLTALGKALEPELAKLNKTFCNCMQSQNNLKTLKEKLLVFEHYFDSANTTEKLLTEFEKLVFNNLSTTQLKKNFANFMKDYLKSVLAAFKLKPPKNKKELPTEFSKLLEISSETVEDDEVELVQSAEKVSFICPFSQKEIVDGLQSEVCFHYFEKEVVLSLLRTAQNNQLSCPQVGCDKILRPNTLIKFFRMDFEKTFFAFLSFALKKQ